MVRGANGAFQEDIWMSNFVVCGVFVAFQNDICRIKWVVGDMWMSKWVVCGVCFEFQGGK